jgi:hypothetical protein
MTTIADMQSTAADELASDNERRDFCLFRLLQAFRATPIRITVVSIALLIPCFWQPHIEAGDLASHVYNAWLVQLIKLGKAPGLWIAPERTNVLFDFMLDWFSKRVGVGSAERLAVGSCVLIFFWSAFALVAAIARKPPWFLMPLLAVLAYGTVFNMGLFNYYLGGSLALAALAILWRATPWDGFVGFLLLVLAWLAQPLPALWAAAMFGYVSLASRLAPRVRLFLASFCLGGLVLLRLFIQRYWYSVWEWRQILHATGADQSYMFGHHYRLITLMILAIWAVVFVQLAQEVGWKHLASSIPVQLYVLCFLGCSLLPYTILFPWYKAAFGGVAERIAWLGAVIMCGVMAEVRNTTRFGWVLAIVALAYFSLLYTDARALNKVEQKVGQLIATLPPDQRILADGIRYPPVDGFEESMIADRACIGKCFSFGNYEPATGQFRVRAAPGNSIVAWSTEHSEVGRRGSHAEQFFLSQPDGILYWIHACGSNLSDVCMDRLSRQDLDSLKGKIGGPS